MTRLLTGIFTAGFLLFVAFVRPSHAQTPLRQGSAGQANSFAQPETNPDVPKNLHTLTQSVFIEVAATIICQIAGVDPINPSQPCLGVDQTTGKIGFVENGGGAISLMGNMIAMLYTPPAGSSQFVSYLADNFGVAKPAYAQTSLQSLSPLLNIWLIFRNLVYLLFVLVFVLIGIGIMLRIKIDPRTVMSIENQIPKLIAGLVLVTFSYTIAAFLIDFMWVATHLMVNVVAGMSPKALSTSTINGNIHTPPMGFANEVYRYKPNPANNPLEATAEVVKEHRGGILEMGATAGLQVQKIISDMFAPMDWSKIDETSTNAAEGRCSGGGVLKDWWCRKWVKISNATGNIVSNALGGAISWIIGILAMLVISIAILFAMFQTWFALLKAYIFLLLDVALAPLWIVSGAFPGGPGPMGWFRDIGANLTAFPTVVTFLLLGKVFATEFSNSTVTNPFVPPLIGTPNPVNLGMLIGLGFILMTPVMLDRVRTAFQAPNIDLSPIGGAIGAGVSPISTAMKAGSEHALGIHYGPEGAQRKGLGKGALGAVLRSITGAH